MSNGSLSLDMAACRLRQQRLIQILQASDLERAIIVGAENVHYLTGYRLPSDFFVGAVCLDADGWCGLVSANEVPQQAAVDDAVAYPAQWIATLRQEQMETLSKSLIDLLDKRPTVIRMGVESSRFGPFLAEAVGVSDFRQTTDIEPQLWQLRRKKDSDELLMIRRAIACSEAMYVRAREVIAPGITELDVYSQLRAAAIEVAGERLTACGNDYQCNSPGGAPRPRPVKSGEPYVLDLGPGYRGYYADNCRTFAVDGKPSDQQLKAWELIVSVLEMVERTVQPGVRCADLFQEAKTILDQYRVDSFCHHLGHGIGLFPHEAPHLNPNWDDVFQEGEVFTAEPGLYGPELKAGIRLEQNYLVTNNGIERLTSFPLDL